jgi:hypothetical protein
VWVLTEDGCEASELKLRDKDGEKKKFNGISVELVMDILTTSMNVVNERGYEPMIPLCSESSVTVCVDGDSR